MPIVLYMEPLSPPSRAVVMVTKAIGLKIEYKIISLANGDNFRPEFLKINPQHTIPTLVDEDIALYDSHAIITYLVSKYGRGDSLYPRDLKKRAIVDQRLHFDTGSLFSYLRLFIKKCLSNRGRTIEEYEKKFIMDSYEILEEILNRTQYMAGDTLTIADLSIIASVTGLDMIVPINSSSFPRISQWVKKIEMLPYYEEVNDAGLKDLRGFLVTISDTVE
ncbi:hypothetical protein HHI36_019747 [Cryptolaemus montrouzieri]|uniref:Uncharacterized protein n=1 Tax=Cryptolaemus montrouzieri TaxID=559131 RepID=A0ABD2N8S2_9CUCU